MRKLSFISLFILLIIFVTATPANAHVVVKPGEVGVGTFQTFTVGVPIEKDLATVEVRLVIPDELKHVTPNVKNGWTIDVKKTGEDKDAKVTEITWTGSSIPAGFREDFQFSAQAPTEAGSLQWKAYQTYEDGSVVAWDQNPKNESKDFSKSGPYSQTKIINDLNKNEETQNQTQNSDTTSLVSIVAIMLSLFAIGLHLKKK